MRPDDTNKRSVSAIQRSIFTLCLDGATPRVTEETYRSSAAVQMLHGGGSQLNSGNRWFDKTLQVTWSLTVEYSNLLQGDFVIKREEQEKSLPSDLRSRRTSLSAVSGFKMALKLSPEYWIVCPFLLTSCLELVGTVFVGVTCMTYFCLHQFECEAKSLFHVTFSKFLIFLPVYHWRRWDMWC